MTARKNGTETGTLKTRMGFLIRRSAHHGMGNNGEGVGENRAVIPGRRREPGIQGFPDVQSHIWGLRLTAHPE
jgi:hypothetical protein